MLNISNGQYAKKETKTWGQGSNYMYIGYLSKPYARTTDSNLNFKWLLETLQATNANLVAFFRG